MLIVAIETATKHVSCALANDDGILASFSLCRPRLHVESLIPAIEQLCDHADVQRSEFTHIAVDVGPGLFTGMRVGVATGRALASALALPMVGIASVDALAHAVRITGRECVTVIDAKRGDVFWAAHHVEGKDSQSQSTDPYYVRAGEIHVTKPEILQQYLDQHDVVLAGESTCISQFSASSALACEAPVATDVAQLAHRAIVNGRVVSDVELEVLYLRQSDAELNRATHEVATRAELSLQSSGKDTGGIEDSEVGKP